MLSVAKIITQQNEKGHVTSYLGTSRIVDDYEQRLHFEEKQKQNR